MGIEGCKKVGGEERRLTLEAQLREQEDESGHWELPEQLTELMNLLLGSMTVIGFSGVGLTTLNLMTTYIAVTTQPKDQDSFAESSGGAGIGLPTWTQGRYVA